MNQKNATRLLIRAIIILLLILSQEDMQYGFYKIANTCVCIGLIGLIILEIKRNFIILTPFLGIGAVIFNPFMKIQLHRADWIWIDQCTIAFFVILTIFEVIQYAKRTY